MATKDVNIRVEKLPDTLRGLAQQPDMMEPAKVLLEVAAQVIEQLTMHIFRLDKECATWKANHDNQVELKRQLQDRPDLAERAVSVQKLQAQIPQWISTKDKLPNKFTQVLLGHNGRAIIGSYHPADISAGFHSNEWNTEVGFLPEDVVQYWMTLPEVPRV